jgi:hypothetical protein
MADALARRDMGTILKTYRKWTGATQTQIAAACEIPQSHVSEIQNGRRQVTAMEIFERFADGLVIPRQRLGLAPRPDAPGTADTSSATAGADVPPGIVRIYPNRGAVPGEVWRALLAGARAHIDILDVAGLFLLDGHADLVSLLRAGAERGATIRYTLGDPDSPAVALRGAEEGSGENLAAHIRRALTRLDGIRDTPGAELRQHRTTVYNSIYRFDGDMLVNTHAYGVPAAQSPVLHLREAPGGLFAHYAASFDRVWATAAPPSDVPVRRRPDGVAAQGKAQRHIAPAPSSTLGPRATVEEIGAAGDRTAGDRDLTAHAAEYPPGSAESVDLVATLAAADLNDDPAVVQARWAGEATAGIITGFLFGQAPEAPPGQESRAGRSVGHADAIRATASHLMDLDFRFGGGHVRRMLLFYFRSEVVPLLRGHHPDPVRREIFRAAAEAAELLGWSAYDAGRFGAAQRYYAQGLRLAREAGDELLGGWMLASLSHQANYSGRFGDAVQLARASYSATRGHASTTVPCLSLAMEARALASLGDAQGCARAIHKAEQLFERRNPDDDPAWIAFFNAEELAGEAAHCYMDLGRPRETRAFSEEALDPHNTPPRTRAFIGMVKAAGALNGGDLDEAVALASEAVDLAAPLRSRRYLRYLTDFQRALTSGNARDPRTVAFADNVRHRYPDLTASPH